MSAGNEHIEPDPATYATTEAPHSGVGSVMFHRCMESLAYQVTVPIFFVVPAFQYLLQFLL